MADESQIRRFYAESGQQSRLDQLERSGGFGAVEADYSRRQSSPQQSQPGQSSVAQNPIDIAKQMFELANQFRQPAIETLKGQAGGITQAYQGLSTAAAGQKPTIEQRYKDTLEDITKTTRGAAASEFTRRGIPLSSGLVEQTVGSRLAPQISQAATQRDVNLQGVDQLLANIGMGEQSAQSGLAQAIAAIQSAGSGEAISSAQNIYSQQEQSRQAELARQQAQSQFDITSGQNQQKIDYDTNKPYYSPNTSGVSVVDPVTQSLLSNLLGGGSTGGGPTESKPTRTPSRTDIPFRSPKGQWMYDPETRQWWPIGE